MAIQKKKIATTSDKKVCEYCGNTGQVHVTVEPIKKDHYGWCRIMPCTKCKHGIEYIKKLDDVSESVETLNNKLRAEMNRLLFPEGRDKVMQELENKIHKLTIGDKVDEPRT